MTKRGKDKSGNAFSSFVVSKMGEKSAHEAASPIEEQESPIEEQKQKLAALLAHRDDVKRLQDLVRKASPLAPQRSSVVAEHPTDLHVGSRTSIGSARARIEAESRKYSTSLRMTTLRTCRTQDFLNKELGNRATPDALVNRGILDSELTFSTRDDRTN